MTPSPARPVWDPGQYLHHADHRLRPVLDLLARVPAELPGRPAPRIADLGCGPGGPSAPLAERYPEAYITGYDNSPAMLAEARAHERPGRLDFAEADLATWRPSPADRFGLLFSNAALQWVPDHVSAFPAWVAALPPGGVLAFQVPGNFSAPSHTLLAELRNAPRWRSRVGAPPRTDAVRTPSEYAERLLALDCAVDAWETTYIHLLTGEDPVLDWVKGTALRPVLTLLDDDPGARDAFLSEYAEALREAYPQGPDGRTPFPFRRVFAVAERRG
ncbi:trans-aconitate 2-methyltransferase [Streptomyces boncukensis]|uniref:Trans-aconitate 2-methyltransferase n=1 Tax=Streptomyces boncukensis TaxID=2711219 RepID=A0A6G4X430_9ACTN|nr:trans-aconitate 2-methyltransferase [Streptomyces boncukensis]NGO71494.1 trans-aconitate 2-methyltransferase [Streptomyces boncukensis]